MKIGTRTLGGASLKVVFCEALPQLKKDLREITHVWCDPASRNQGIASLLMQQVCDEADAKRMVLVLTADPYGEDPSLTKEKLASWYCNKFFFNPIQQEPLILARAPFPQQVAPAVAESQIILPQGA